MTRAWLGLPRVATLQQLLRFNQPQYRWGDGDGAQPFPGGHGAGAEQGLHRAMVGESQREDDRHTGVIDNKAVTGEPLAGQCMAILDPFS